MPKMEIVECECFVVCIEHLIEVDKFKNVCASIENKPFYCFYYEFLFDDHCCVSVHIHRRISIWRSHCECHTSLILRYTGEI